MLTWWSEDGTMCSRLYPTSSVESMGNRGELYAAEGEGLASSCDPPLFDEFDPRCLTQCA